MQLIDGYLNRFPVYYVNLYFPWMVTVLAYLGLAGAMLSSLSFTLVRRLRFLSEWMIAAGLLVAVPILTMALSEDSQPPGSSLAMIVSMFGSVLWVLFHLATAIGTMGLLLQWTVKN
jgi:hypothetical protein